MNIERIKEELARTYVKIEKLQKKARDLEEQKKQAEDMEYLKIIRSNGVSAEELQLMIDISKEEQKKILETREKEQTENEEISLKSICIFNRSYVSRTSGRSFLL